jgi:hypothetical protein
MGVIGRRLVDAAGDRDRDNGQLASPLLSPLGGALRLAE